MRRILPSSVRRVLRDSASLARRPFERRGAYRRLSKRVSSAPQTFTEKVIYKMAFDRRPILTTFADKVAAREYVSDRLGPEYLTQCHGVFARGRDIDWDRLPREFVLKATHGSGAVAVVWEGSPRGVLPRRDQEASWSWRGTIHPDDLDRKELARLANGWVRLTHEIPFRGALPEWAYSRVPPRIIAEELLLGPDNELPPDYKFFMMDGDCSVVQLVAGRFGEQRLALFSSEWGHLPVTRAGFGPPIEEDLERPANLDVMLHAARTLSKGIDFVRVDLYDLGHRVVFGELTNYPSAGKMGYRPVEFDGVLGARWQVPSRYDSSDPRG